MLTYLGRHVLRLKTDRTGLETIEYAIIAAIVVGVGFVGYNTLFGGVSTATAQIGKAVSTAGTNAGSSISTATTPAS